MPTPVIMPKFEMTQETGKVLAWLKNEGERIEKGEPLLEVETDKVNQEVESPASGILAGIAARPGEVVPIATPIAYILKPGEVFNPQPAAAPTEATSSGPASTEQAGAGMTGTAPSGEAGNGHAKATPLAIRLAESFSLDLNRITGTGPLGRITKEDVEAELARLQSNGREAVWEGKVRAAPAARRVARELGIELSGVKGTGPEGRVQPEDVELAAARLAAAVTPVSASPPAPEPLASPRTPAAPAGGIAVRRTVPLTNVRRTIAERMTASVREAPQFTVSVDVNMTKALGVVEDLKAPSGEDKPKITLTALIVKACAWALREHPEANASFQGDGADAAIVEWDEVNVGVATAIDQGLIVPVVRLADGLGLRAIAGRLGDLTRRARDGKLKLEDLQAGTFTVSNLGMFGIDRFTAIVNPPQAAILAVGRVAKRAEVVTGQAGEDRVEIRPMASLALTADHRVLDGAAAARLLATIQRVLEHPGLLME